MDSTKDVRESAKRSQSDQVIKTDMEKILEAECQVA